jgi:hypothetical protein
MLKKMLCKMLIVFPLIANAETIKFCVNNNNYSYPQFTVDSQLHYYNYTHSTYCWDVTPAGNKFVVLFTNGFDLNYDGVLCGNVNPCLIPLTKAGKLTAINTFVSKQNDKVSGTLSAEYAG